MIDLPDIDVLVGLDAVVHQQPTFTTMDVADWLRANRSGSSLAARGNPEIGRFLSTNKSLLMIEAVGVAGRRGQGWRRTLAGNAVAMIAWLIDHGYHRQVLQMLKTIRPALAEQYEEILAKLTDKKKDEKEEQRPSRTRTRPRPWRPPAPIEDPAEVTWDDPRLQVKSDPAQRARYRRLQSWYRQERLGVPPGRNDTGRLVGSMLDLDATIANPGLNFLSEAIAAYVDQRVPEIIATGGTLDADRLRRNMLSSQPLCFNLFGVLRAHPEAAAAVLSVALDLEIDVIEEITVEYAPLPSQRYLADRTAFDALVVYRTHEGRRGFVGVETKYTEPFSPTVYTAAANPRYAHWTTSQHGFKDGAVHKLEHKSVNQLWRNAMLAVAYRVTDGFDHGHVAVVGCTGDNHIAEAVKRLSTQHSAPRDLVRATTFDRIVDRAALASDLAPWAAAFRERYLDLAPVSPGAGEADRG